MNLLIVDDERLARTELIRQINLYFPDVSFSEASSVVEARGIIMASQIDAVFLDLEMPVDHGFDFIPELRASGIPVVITTAHECFAIAAFEHEVADYLLKPIEKRRLGIALAKLGRTQVRSRTESTVVFFDHNNCWPVNLGKILMIEATGGYVTLHVKDQAPITLCRNLKELEELIDIGNFVRANRSQIVRLRALKSIKRLPGGLFSAHVEGVGSVEFSRRQSQAFRQRYGF